MDHKAKPRPLAGGAGVRTYDLTGERVEPPYRASKTKRKGPSAHGQLRLEVVHHWSVIGGQAWLIVLRGGADKKTVAAYGSLDDAIDQLGSWSQKLGAKIVGRGSEIQHDRVQS
jgi:hypothetical protein